MCGSINTLKHTGVRNTLRLAYPGCKNLAHTNKTYHVKRNQSGSGTPESAEMRGTLPSSPFTRGEAGAEVPFHNSITGHFMVYKDRLETNLLQLFAHSEIQNDFL